MFVVASKMPDGEFHYLALDITIHFWTDYKYHISFPTESAARIYMNKNLRWCGDYTIMREEDVESILIVMGS